MVCDAAAATEVDRCLADFIPGMREGDMRMVTADHGCDPSYTKTTDHTREYVPYLVCGKGVKPGVDLGTRLCFGTIAQTVCEYLGVDASSLYGHSVPQEILKKYRPSQSCDSATERAIFCAKS